jgi:hypothetical protein
MTDPYADTAGLPEAYQRITAASMQVWRNDPDAESE